MVVPEKQELSRGTRHFVYPLLLCVCGVALNLALARLALLLRLPLFLDSVGTVLAAVLGGYLPGIVVGYVTNLINGVSDPVTAYYASINVLLALAATWFFRNGAFRRLFTAKNLLAIVVFALIGGGLGSLLTFLLYKRISPLLHKVATDFL